ncbi:helix-turn-helix domain-containing protein [Streptomyces sp. NPDC002952]|uniref:helix-turn-helix domain-containing protein n=1 Tax=Streptomyces sp. NPDC002952 TaxID=3364673 RepID=UPI00369A65C7
MRARGEIIRRSREESGYGLREFASRIRISPSYLSRIERNQVSPSPGVVKKIAVELREAREARAAIAEITRSEDEACDDTPE